MKDSKKKKDVFSVALECVSRSNLSEFELTTRLERKSYSEDEVRQAVDKMVGYGYVDDHKVVNSLMRKAQRDCRGPGWLKIYLLKKRIPKDIGKDAIQELSDMSASLASQILKSKLARNKTSKNMSKDKLFRFLAGRGFYGDAIEKAFIKMEEQI